MHTTPKTAATSTPPFSRTVIVEAAGLACDLLARASGLSKSRVKDCMIKGGVWRRKNGQRAVRLRRATAAVSPGEHLEMHYDARLLTLTPPEPELVFSGVRYSVWNKPAGVLAQGTRFADHCALPRLAQTRLGLQTEPRPVHRLDREARGLTLLAHNTEAAACLSGLFRDSRVEKAYMATVAGLPLWTDAEADGRLDGRACRSMFHVLQRDTLSGTTLITARIETGRRHQIRRHLAALGHPVLGDPRYGRHSACPHGLQLLAHSLAFICPFTSAPMRWTLPPIIFPLPAR